jgi:hypothetical protein
MPLVGATYVGHYEGGASVVDADGTVLAVRHRGDGPGHAIAEVTPRRVAPVSLPDRFWLQRRGLVAGLTWAVQNAHGRHEYRATGAQQPLPAATERALV